MNATTPVRTSHLDCDHPATKVARAACRRARKSAAPVWVNVARGEVAKGAHVQVVNTETGESAQGTLLGWGAKVVQLRVDQDRVVFDATETLVSVPSEQA